MNTIQMVILGIAILLAGSVFFKQNPLDLLKSKLNDKSKVPTVDNPSPVDPIVNVPVVPDFMEVVDQWNKFRLTAEKHGLVKVSEILDNEIFPLLNKRG